MSQANRDPGSERGRDSSGAGPGAWHEDVDDATRARRSAYWRRNIRSVGILLAIWFLVSYGLGILWVEPLNELTLPGTHYPLGFWFAQQGAIYVFVILIFVYVRLMNRLDREFDVDERDVEVPAEGLDHLRRLSGLAALREAQSYKERARCAARGSRP